jgi:hypothetical protein
MLRWNKSQKKHNLDETDLINKLSELKTTAALFY